MDSTVPESRSVLDHRPPRCRSRRLMTPLSAPMSRLVLPAGSESSWSTLLYLACLSTDRLNSFTAHSDCGWLLTGSGSTCSGGNRSRQLEGPQCEEERSDCSDHPAESNPLDDSGQSPTSAEERCRDGNRHRYPAEEIDQRQLGGRGKSRQRGFGEGVHDLGY